jgi:hypothetical protein
MEIYAWAPRLGMDKNRAEHNCSHALQLGSTQFWTGWKEAITGALAIRGLLIKWARKSTLWGGAFGTEMYLVRDMRCCMAVLSSRC